MNIDSNGFIDVDHTVKRGSWSKSKLTHKDLICGLNQGIHLSSLMKDLIRRTSMLAKTMKGKY